MSYAADYAIQCRERWLREHRPGRDANEAGLVELADLYAKRVRGELTKADRERERHLYSHLRLRVTLNPGPPAIPGEDLAKWETQARWVLDGIAQNPDGHHWTYVASAIQEAVEEAHSETNRRIREAAGAAVEATIATLDSEGRIDDTPAPVCDRYHGEVLEGHFDEDDDGSPELARTGEPRDAAQLAFEHGLAWGGLGARGDDVYREALELLIGALTVEHKFLSPRSVVAARNAKKALGGAEFCMSCGNVFREGVVTVPAHPDGRRHVLSSPECTSA